MGHRCESDMENPRNLLMNMIKNKWDIHVLDLEHLFLLKDSKIVTCRCAFLLTKELRKLPELKINLIKVKRVQKKNQVIIFFKWSLFWNHSDIILRVPFKVQNYLERFFHRLQRRSNFFPFTTLLYSNQSI